MSTFRQPLIRFSHHLGQDPLPASEGSQMAYTLFETGVAPDAAEAAPLPLNVCLVLDQSLSMRGEKMARVKEAARYVFSQLDAHDAFSIISFNDRATVVQRAQINPLANTVGSAIEGITPRGGTELAAGLKAGLEELVRGRNLTGRAISSMLVLTDGRTYGDESRCLDMAEEARKRDLLITPLGIGEEWNEDLLETIAYRCGSHSEYIDRPAAIVAAFRQHIEDLRKIWGRQAQLTIHTAPDTRLVQIHRVAPLIGRLDLLPGPNVSEQTYALGNLVLSEPQAFLMEIVLPAVATGRVEIANCVLQWQPTDPRHGEGKAVYTIASTVDPFAGPAVTLDSAVKIAVEKVVAYKLQKRAWQDLQAGNLVQATTKLRMVATRLLAAGEPDLARTVQEEAEHLEKHGVASATGTKQIKYGTRGLGRTRSMRSPEQALN